MLVKGVVLTVEPTASCIPLGWVSNPSSTVRGSRRTCVEPAAPAESVAVRTSSRYDGYSWSGATNDPCSWPATVEMTWVWQLDVSAQWCITNDHVSLDGASRPSSGSSARPENEMTSPTAHRRSPVGALIM